MSSCQEIWINPIEKFPDVFELVRLKTDRGNYSGWWTGKKWYGLRIKKSDVITAWTIYNK